MERRVTWIAALAFVALCRADSDTAAAPLQYFNIHQDIVHDTEGPPSRNDEWLDSTFLLAWPQAHASVTLGSFDAGAEFGGFLRDRRGSNYGMTLRRRTGGMVQNTSAEFDTQQKMARTVWSAAMRLFWPDHPEEDNLALVPSAGVDWYYTAESFCTVRVTRDPRVGAGTTIRLSNRVGTLRRYCDMTLAPRTDGAIGFALYGRWDWFMGGFGRETDYDFTNIDRQTIFFGFQYDM